MISYTELQTRLARFVDAEMLPHMTGGKRILLGGYAALATKNAAGMLQAAKDKPLVAMTGAVSGMAWTWMRSFPPSVRTSTNR